MKRICVFAFLSCLWLAGCGADPGATLTDVTDRRASPGAKRAESLLSPMGRAAARARAALARRAGVHVSALSEDDCVNRPDCEDEGAEDGPRGGQAEVSIATDATGRHVVVGFNDTRGFLSDPVSVSGYLYSDDGGTTFTDGGQLPSPGTDTIGGERFPQVYGDPDVKYLGGCTFVYSSILLVKYGADQVAQTMGVHRSRDCGHTWEGPFEVTAVTNPSGLTDPSGAPVDAADKEFMDVDPDTGRVLLSWTNFTPVAVGFVEISATYSDDLLSATPPTWSARKVLAATEADGQGSVPRFAGRGSGGAYVSWTRYPQPGMLGGYGSNIAFARSLDNGETWEPARDISPEFFTMDQVLGNDRVHTFPSMAVDTSPSRHRGNVYVVFADNDSKDGADVALVRSTDGGATFSAPVLLDARPGADRAQWFPVVTVDRLTGRVHVFYYDQGVADSGDLTETSYTYSDDGGVHFSPPVPLTSQPFHAGWGNDTSQPNLGDYNQGVAQFGNLLAAFAVAKRPPGGFADGQPDTFMTVPDVFFRRVTLIRQGDDGSDDDTSIGPVNGLPVRLGAVTYTDSGRNGNIDPGELISLRVPLRNYVENPLSARRLTALTARLSSPTPGVSVVSPISVYPSLDPGATAAPVLGFALRTAPGFVPGTPIELVLHVVGLPLGGAVLRTTLFTGTPRATTLLSENFEGGAPGALPAGWTSVHGAGRNTVPWTASATFCGGRSTVAFHPDAIDGPTPMADPTRWERLVSPAVDVPAGADHVVLEFDVCYNTEDDPNFRVLAYDGLFLRITDLTPGRTTRSVLAEAFADEFTTGPLQHYPKHLPRNGNPAYFEDMSAWAGASGGLQHVRLRLPGMAGSRVQLRFEYTQDSAATCTDAGHPGPCGVAVDNVVMKSVAVARP